MDGSAGRPPGGGAITLIAGAGSLPREAARSLAARGVAVSALAFDDVTDPGLHAHVQAIRSVPLGALSAAGEALASLAATSVLALGKLPRPSAIDGAGAAAGLDDEARALLASSPGLGDDSLMATLLGWLEARGIELAEPARWLSEMVVREGVLAARAPSKAERTEARRAIAAARAVGDAGIAQCLVVKAGAVLAVEAAEGTDETIRRGGRLGGDGTLVLKFLRGGQDRRMDLPAVGPGTLAAMRTAGARALALEANGVLVLDRPRFVEEADRDGVAVWAMRFDGAPS